MRHNDAHPNKTENPSKDALDKTEIMQSANYANSNSIRIDHQTIRSEKTDQ